MAGRKSTRTLPGEAGGDLPPITSAEDASELRDAPTLPPDAPLPVQQGPALQAGEVGVLVEGEDPADLFVSCVPSKGPVTRFGSSGGSTFLGARRDPKAEGGIAYFPEQVALVAGAEHRRFAREYGRVLREGALVVRTRAEYVAYRAARAQRAEAAKVEREKKAAAAAQAASEAKPEPAAAPDLTTTGG